MGRPNPVELRTRITGYVDEGRVLSVNHLVLRIAT